MRALLIHGAGASPLFWRVFQDSVDLETVLFSYDVTQESFSRISERATEAASSEGCDAVIGHSFGGVVAWRVAQDLSSIRGGVSVASPWAGSQYCDVIDMLTLGIHPNRFFSNVSKTSPHLTAPRIEPVRCPWLNVVTTRNPFHSHPPNDGVLTVRSQESLYTSENVMRVYMNYGHSEVLLSEELPVMVESFLTGVVSRRSRSGRRSG